MSYPNVGNTGPRSNAQPQNNAASQGNAPVQPLDPLFTVVNNILTEIDFRRSIKLPLDCLDSGPMVNVTLTSLKNVPYVLFGDTALLQQFDNGLSARMRYGEALLMGLAGVVYNFVFSLFFTAASVVTLGQVQMISDQMKKHWVHTAEAVAAVGISVVGIVSPEHGLKANAMVLMAGAGAVFKTVTADLVNKVVTSYQKHAQALKDAGLHACEGDQGDYSRSFGPLLNYFDRNLTPQRVTTVEKLLETLWDAKEFMPDFNNIPDDFIDPLIERIGSMNPFAESSNASSSSSRSSTNI